MFINIFVRPTYDYIYSIVGKPVSWMMVAPSITPRRWHGASSNPGLRIYNYNTDTGQVNRVLDTNIDQ